MSHLKRKSVGVMDSVEVLLTPICFAQENLQKRKQFSINFLHSVSHVQVFCCLFVYEDDVKPQVAGGFSISAINNSVSNESRVDCFDV